jgi:hypothetical protein
MSSTNVVLPWTGARKALGRANAIHEYVLLRMRAEECGALDYLLKALRDGRITVPTDSPHSRASLVDVARTCALSWFASLTDRDSRTVYPFNCLLVLFGHRRSRIICVQRELEQCHSTVHQFRNTVGPHFNCDLVAHIAARTRLQNLDNYLDLISAIKGFQRLVDDLKAEEANVIPELPTILEKLGVTHLPAFSQYHKVSQSEMAAAKGW